MTFLRKIYFLLIILTVSRSLYGQSTDGLREKVNYIDRLANNITWPSYAIGSTFKIGVIGDEQTVEEIKSILNNRVVKRKKYEIKHFQKVREIEQTPILYITASSKLFISSIFQELSGKPTLLITEKTGFAAEGGSDINFVQSANEWFYEIFPQQIEGRGLYVPDRVVDDAIEVIEPEPEKEVKVIRDLEVITQTKYVDNPGASGKIKDLQARLDEQTKKLTERIKEVGLNPEEEKELSKQLDSLGIVLSNLQLIKEKREAEAKAAQAEADRQKAERRRAESQKETVAARQRTQRAIFIAAILFLAALAIIFYYFSQRRKKIIDEVNKARNELADKVHEINRQNELLEESARIMDQKNREIKDKNDTLTVQTEALEEQNRKITDSIRYALTIQQAMLPGTDRLGELFSENFIIYIPKDIVSGDFYWATRHQEKTLVAVIDCTGHGVPGAFMSTIGTDLLNEIVNEKRHLKPSTILELLHLGIYKRLRQRDTNNRDGMDVCLCMIEPNKEEKDKYKVTFAGAKRPLYYTHEDTLQKISGDSKYIGGIRRTKQAFTNQEIHLTKGDTLYLTTDGYVDTPAPDRSKFGSLQFQELLAEIRHKPLVEQKEILLHKLKEHQQDTKSRDDITILGIKI